MFPRREDMPIILEKVCFVNILKVHYHDFYLSAFFSICEKQRLSHTWLFLFLIPKLLLPFHLIEYITFPEIKKNEFNLSKRESTMCNNVLSFHIRTSTKLRIINKADRVYTSSHS